MVTAASLLVLLVVLLVTRYVLKRWKYFWLPSPGLELPVIGHTHLLMSQEAKRDQVGFMVKTWRKFQKNGMMFLRSFSLNLMVVGDFDTLKYIYNHPDVQARMTGTGMEWASIEDRKIKSKEIPGVILRYSCGKFEH